MEPRKSIIPGADDVLRSEGNTDGHVSASARETWRGRRSDVFIGERIGRCRLAGGTYQSQMEDSDRLRLPPSKTKSSRGQSSRC